MASYDLLKTITIDGVTMGLDNDLGKVIVAQVLKNIPTANTDIVGATQTITEPGTYLVLAHWTFPSASTTGNRSSSVCVGWKRDGETSYTVGKRQYEASAGNQYIHIFAPWVFSVDTELPLTLASIGRSTVTSSTQDYSQLYVCKLVNTIY